MTHTVETVSLSTNIGKYVKRSRLSKARHVAVVIAEEYRIVFLLTEANVTCTQRYIYASAIREENLMVPSEIRVRGIFTEINTGALTRRALLNNL